MGIRNLVTRLVGGRDRRRGRATRAGANGAGGGARSDGMRITYAPENDGRADPGEVVWTWVPYEDDPQQGKDRPVVVIGRWGDRLAVVPLSSRGPEDRPDPEAWVSVGSGQWDGEGRTSYANVDRVLRVAEDEVRREGATLGRGHFDDVAAAVRRRHPDLG